MATTNLISKSLGDILTESGSGTPNHTSPKGSIYTNLNTGTQFINNDGVSGWTENIWVSYGEIYFQDATANSSISVHPTWTRFTGETYTLGEYNGVSASSGRLQIDTGRGGKYDVICSGSIEADTANNNSYNIGFGINASGATDGHYGTTTVNTGGPTHATVTVRGIVDLNDGDTVEVLMSQHAGTDTVTLLHTALNIRRIGDI
jgi:hypothetical protein